MHQEGLSAALRRRGSTTPPGDTFFSTGSLHRKSPSPSPASRIGTGLNVALTDLPFPLGVRLNYLLPHVLRRQIKSEAATFFNSLDENSDGVLEKEEIREFVIDVGGSTLDDTSEIWGGVSRVMGRLDTDSDEGIGLKELRCCVCPCSLTFLLCRF